MRSIMNITNQYSIADDLALQLGLSQEQARTIFVNASGGSALVALEASTWGWVVNGQPVTDPTGDSLRLLNALKGSMVGSDRDFWAYEGQPATYVTAAGIMAAENIVGQAADIFRKRGSEWRSNNSLIASNVSFPSSIMNESFVNRIWASPFYTKQDRDMRSGYYGWDYKAGGLSLGFDRWFGNFNVGAAFTYSRAKVSEDGANDDNKINNYSGWLYATYRACNGFFLNMTGGYNYGDNDMKRYIGSTINRWQTASNHTSTWWIGGDVGYDFRASSNFTLTPSVGLYYLTAKSSAFAYQGAFVGAHVNEIKDKSLLLPVELTATYHSQLNECSAIDVNVSGGYTYNFKNDGAKGDMYYDYNPAYPIFIQGVKPGQNSWNIGAGLKYNYKRFDVGVDYRYIGGSDYKSHNVSATVGVKF